MHRIQHGRAVSNKLKHRTYATFKYSKYTWIHLCTTVVPTSSCKRYKRREVVGRASIYFDSHYVIWNVLTVNDVRVGNQINGKLENGKDRGKQFEEQKKHKIEKEIRKFSGKVGNFCQFYYSSINLWMWKAKRTQNSINFGYSLCHATASFVSTLISSMAFFKCRAEKWFEKGECEWWDDTSFVEQL